MAFMTTFSSVPQFAALIAAPVTAIAATTLVVRSLTVPAATPDMTIVVNWPALDTGLLIGQATCDVAGTVKLSIYNVTGGSITPAAQTLHILGL